MAAQRRNTHCYPFPPVIFLRHSPFSYTLYWNSELVVISLAADDKTFDSAYWHWQNVKRPTVQARKI